MQRLETNGEPQPKANGKPEIRFKAQAVSRGVAVGKVVSLYGTNRQFYRTTIAEGDIRSQIRRLNAAIRLARRQLNRLSRSGNGAAPGIFQAQILILDDPGMLERITAEISDKRVNAEWAVKTVTDQYIAECKALPDEHLRERYVDIEDVADRILTALGGSAPPAPELGTETIIAAQELRPSTLAEMVNTSPRAIMTEHGGWTSHTFILARELNLPAVTGLKKLLRRVKTGDTVVVDGYNGHVIVHPTEQTLQRYAATAAPERADDGPVDQTDAPPATLDRREITIRANLDIPSVYKRAKRRGARGIGLYRSEFLFNQFKGLPSENEQAEAYAEIADYAGADGVNIRTFDLNVEQLYGQNAEREKNPALGLRAIRLGLSQPKHFRTQLRAILRASSGRKIDIVIPMISGVPEMRETRRLLQREAASLKAKGIDIGSPRLGAMIEVPSAILVIDEILEESDFILLGTNDLVQYLLAVDRDNEAVSGWFRTLHPAVIRALTIVVSAAERANKQIIVCGEMAGSPYYVPILLGMGARELSMNVNSILRVRKMVSGINYSEAREAAEQLLRCRTSAEIEESLRAHIEKNWRHLFPADFLRDSKI